MQTTILNISYSACAVAFLLLGLLIGLNWRQSRYAVVLLASIISTIIWAVGAILSQLYLLPTILLAFFEIAHIASWLIFLGLVLGVSPIHKGILNSRLFITLVSSAIAVILGIYTLSTLNPGTFHPEVILLVVGSCFMSLSIIGLLLLENIYRNTDQDGRWSIKFICFGLGALFSYDFFYYADIVLFRSLNDSLFLARGFVNALIVPLLAISIFRTRSWSLDLHISRNVVVHTAALLICGLYLLVMAGAGYFVRQYGGTWGTVIQITFIFAALLLLIVLVSSGALRTKARLFISRNFYSTKYDYRTEWLRFVKTISSGSAVAPLPNRILHAFTQIVGSTSAALWVLAPKEDRFTVAAKWNMGETLPDEPLPSPLLQILEQECSVLEIDTLRSVDTAALCSEITNWFRDETRAWLILPLIHRQSVQGIIVLGTPRAQRQIDWEDQELLMTVGRQAASYLAEEEAANALNEAKQFETFNKRFAFVAHDIKNIVNQLSLMVKNSEIHGANPDFQSDMLETVESSVTRMTDLLRQLSAKRSPARPKTPQLIDLSACLTNLEKQWQKSSARIEFDIDPRQVHFSGNQDRLISAINHLIQNALDATSAGGRNVAIILRSKINAEDITVDVVDNGAGMDAAFIRNELFQPLSSTKESGFGIGVYQVREYIEQMGGTLKVESDPGQGTMMRIIFPLAGTLNVLNSDFTTQASS